MKLAVKSPNISILRAQPHEIAEIKDFYISVGYTNTANVNPNNIILIARHEAKLIGVVRLVLEEGTCVLRGMQIAAAYQKQGIGRALLQELDQYIGDSTCFCLAHAWLESFYGSIGFVQIAAESAPLFLQRRFKKYKTTEFPDLIVMKREKYKNVEVVNNGLIEL